ncbi:hypothetical protein D3C80_2132600 [compost metagenome]
MEQRGALLDDGQRCTCGRAAVIAKVDRAQRLVTNHSGGLAVDTYKAQAAEQVHIWAQRRAQLIFNAQAILQ